MAHKKGLGSSKNGRDSNPKYLGVKMFDGQLAKPGNIIVRQRGTRFHPGPGTEMGRDDSIFAVRNGHGLVPDERRAPHRVGSRSRPSRRSCSTTGPGFASRPARAATAA